jgi:RNA polymerase subunit RPABC4/transcription elongation factor Spt4
MGVSIRAARDDGTKKIKAARGGWKPLPKACPSCSYVRPAGVHKCPVCSFAPERQVNVETKDGELVLLDRKKRKATTGVLARGIYEKGAGKAGVWNQNEVNKALNSVIGQKILQTFPPDEVAAFHTLNYGGQIMPGVHAYEGAAQQAARLNKPGFVEKYGAKAGSTVGSALGYGIGRGQRGGKQAPCTGAGKVEHCLGRWWRCVFNRGCHSGRGD